jgi:hypothetical protein
MAIIYGTVSKDGKKLGGNDYSVSHTKDSGIYFITFEQPFNKLPGASTTQIYPNDPSSQGGKTTDNALLIYLSTEQMNVKTGDGNGTASDRDFTFIVVGD